MLRKIAVFSILKSMGKNSIFNPRQARGFRAVSAGRGTRSFTIRTTTVRRSAQSSLHSWVSLVQRRSVYQIVAYPSGRLILFRKLAPQFARQLSNRSDLKPLEMVRPRPRISLSKAKHSLYRWPESIQAEGVRAIRAGGFLLFKRFHQG